MRLNPTPAISHHRDMWKRSIYYKLKPFLPWRVRIALRRVLVKRRLRDCGNIWPIDPACAARPPQWPGWPDGKQFAFVLTHDVEGPAGLARCERLAELERKMGFISSFNLIPEGDYVVPAELRKRLEDMGCEVGIHDLHHDGKLYRSRSEFAEKAKRINHYMKEWGAVGFRAGFMFHNLEWLHDITGEYDASTFDVDPFEPQPDGVGTIFPFFVPAPATGKTSARSHEPEGYVELPYTLPQDSTLFFLLREKTSAIWTQKCDWLAQHGGMVLVNVHPDYLRFSDDPPRAAVFPIERYEELLQHVKSRYAGSFWHALPRDIGRYVRRHLPPPAATMSAPKTC